MKTWFLKKLANKYAGAATAWAVGASVSGITAYLANGPAWVGQVVSSVLSATSQGEITEVNPMTLTLVLTPLVASAIQAGIGMIQASNIEKIQEQTGEVVDGWAGPETVNAVVKK